MVEIQVLSKKFCFRKHDVIRLHTFSAELCVWGMSSYHMCSLPPEGSPTQPSSYKKKIRF